MLQKMSVTKMPCQLWQGIFCLIAAYKILTKNNFCYIIHIKYSKSVEDVQKQARPQKIPKKRPQKIQTI